ERRRGNQWRNFVAQPGLADGAEFFQRVGPWIKLVARGNLDTAVCAQHRNLCAPVSVINERTERNGRGGNRPGNLDQVHGRGTQNKNLPAGEKRRIRSARLELTEVDVRDRRRQRVASQRRKALRRAAKNQQRITAGVSDADQQLGELSGVPQV